MELSYVDLRACTGSPCQRRRLGGGRCCSVPASQGRPESASAQLSLSSQSSHVAA